MSASLVGSEMCIRDSYTAAGNRRAARRPTTRDGRAWPTTADVLGWERAVSYTHLTLPTICSV
eukprot:1241860-Alexandrium_andersonii.AAC.1